MLGDMMLLQHVTRERAEAAISHFCSPSMPVLASFFVSLYPWSRSHLGAVVSMNAYNLASGIHTPW